MIFNDRTEAFEVTHFNLKLRFFLGIYLTFFFILTQDYVEYVWDKDLLIAERNSCCADDSNGEANFFSFSHKIVNDDSIVS